MAILCSACGSLPGEPEKPGTVSTRVEDGKTVMTVNPTLATLPYTYPDVWVGGTYWVAISVDASGVWSFGVVATDVKGVCGETKTLDKLTATMTCGDNEIRVEAKVSE